MAASRPTSSYPNSFFQRSMWYQTPSIRPNDPRTSISIGSPTPVASRNGPTSTPLTVVLLESQPFALVTATESPFLLAAGQGKLAKSMLSKWLSQARLVAQAQLSLVGALISRVDLPYGAMTDEAKAASLRWRIVDILTHALNQAQQDLAFFTSVASEHDLDLEFPPRPDAYFTADESATQFIRLYRAFWTDPTMSLLEGLTVLWCSLHCRLASWRCAKRQLSPFHREDLDGGAIRRGFVPRWTSVEFEAFVAEVADVTNLLYERDEAGKRMTTFKAVWQHILNLERTMWPDM